VTASTDHYIVCGGNSLANRLVEELVTRYKVPVTSIVPPGDDPHISEIGKRLGADAVLVSDRLTEDALRSAGVARARGIAFVGGDDQGNIQAALRVQRMSRGIQIVVRMYNQRLGEHIRDLITNCVVLSASETAAPAFVNAGLRRPATVQAGGRTLYIAQRQHTGGARELCTVAEQADPTDADSVSMLPRESGAAMRWIERDVLRLPDAGGGQAVLSYMDHEPRVRLPRLARLRWRLLDMWRFFTSAQLRMVLAVSGAAVATAFVGIWLVRPIGWAVYETLMNLAGSAVPDTFGVRSGVGGGWQRVFQVVTTFGGILLVPIVTAVLIENTGSRRRGGQRLPNAGIRGHFVIVGLGTVGTRAALLTADLGVPVICVERDPEAGGIDLVRSRDIAVVTDASIETALAKARVDTCRAVLTLTGDDVTNLEAALEAHAINPNVRVVVRLFDDDFAAHLENTIDDLYSQSMSYLSAPAFAAALMGQEVRGTLPVYSHVLLIAEIAIAADSKLREQPLREIDADGEIRVIALRRSHQQDFTWQPADHGYRLAPDDTIIVAATRAGFRRLLLPRAPS
jgi:Trk K+ transport system NAD-binding subunit